MCTLVVMYTLIANEQQSANSGVFGRRVVVEKSPNNRRADEL
ncbi:hypothetical protein CORC01_11555 [Colletotrichum orchidophilum]|uniref:Uncharacterized protein n=1 Tax=Colletotrichum orchidophilum TaxID=1209926 RepID=A0A1G4AVQ6_9PEZI|nr:uncharacterized protein CORC01_11555 [Colletotrichum orchidophilum]OHE93143.1 hypothetical protein CORC01_11555 [Colletotrichum orchidophilum]